MQEPRVLYFDILDLLSKQGLGVNTNLKTLCSNYIDKVDESKELSDAFEAFSKNWARVMAIIDSLERVGYIKFSKEHGDMSKLYIVDGNFSVSITKEGLDYYYSYILKLATLKSFRNQKWYNRSALLVASCAAAISLFTLFKKDQKQPLIIQLPKLKDQPAIIYPQTNPIHKIPDTTVQKKQGHSTQKPPSN